MLSPRQREAINYQPPVAQYSPSSRVNNEKKEWVATRNNWIQSPPSFGGQAARSGGGGGGGGERERASSIIRDVPPQTPRQPHVRAAPAKTPPLRVSPAKTPPLGDFAGVRGGGGGRSARVEDDARERGGGGGYSERVLSAQMVEGPWDALCVLAHGSASQNAEEQVLEKAVLHYETQRRAEYLRNLCLASPESLSLSLSVSLSCVRTRTLSLCVSLFESLSLSLSLSLCLPIAFARYLPLSLSLRVSRSL